MTRSISRYSLSLFAFILTAIILCFVQWKVERPMLLAERFIPGSGWVELVLAAVYAAWITAKMKDPGQSAKWRRITWTIFTVIFFSQLAIGLISSDKFLMTGKPHLPIPLMILSGPVFRGNISFMPILFISTLIISGPAWCSQLCYFGALDNIAAGRRLKPKTLNGKFRFKHLMLIGIITLTLLLRYLNVPTLWTTIIAGTFGVAGLAIIVLISRKRGSMVHCILWCPIGTLVNYFKLVSPFRMEIDNSCTDCMACTRYCNYDALNKSDIVKRKPGLTCTYCGDCITSCKTESIRYKFLGFSSIQARNIWIVLTVSLHAIFMALARM